ncbi:hypothetical protein D0511_03040 [Pseudoalteromonas piscicida]|uniref:Uncharacterized protein n=2 Tax=Pseudoalteromonas piscicida TaxID=43662 RepID=A0AAD0RF74_PSEO7|nr:hypothetical protein D0N37_16015 [Pseudoalteromonas piscicida]AXR01156.1 hypothetical protein D0511_03040 [Pseudoalteromonas piscicida]
MENMFKKSLLALALAGVATSASAVQTTVTEKTIGVEGVAAAAKGLTLDAKNDIKLTLGAEYTAGDIIKITAAGGTFADTEEYTLVADETAGAQDDVTFGLLNSTDSVLTFRVTNVEDNGAGTAGTKGGVYSLTAGAGADAAVAFKVTSIANEGKVTLTSKAETAQGISIDTTKNDTDTVFLGANQFKLEITEGKGTIDVAEMRKKFADGTYSDASLAFTVTAVEAGAVTNDGYEVVITGDFAGVDKVTVGAKEATIATDKSSAKAVVDGAALATGNVAVAFTLPADDAKKSALTAQTFTADVNLIDADDKAVLALANDSAVATWKLNGDTEFVEIMPFTDAYSRYITVTNNGTVEGDISVELYFNGKMVAAKKVGTAGKHAVNNITAAVDALAKENEVTGVAGIRVTTNAPEANIEVSALYYNKEVQDHVKVN